MASFRRLLRLFGLAPIVSLLLISLLATHSPAQQIETLDSLIRPHEGKLLHFSSTDPGEENGVSRPIAAGATFTLQGLSWHGQVRISVHKQVLGVFDGYFAGVRSTGPVSPGRAPFQAGAKEVTLEIIGKAAPATGYYVGLDGFLLKP